MNTFFKIFTKTLIILKKEPIILIPFLIFNIGIATLSQITNFAQTNVMFNASLEWLIPSLLIQPIILIVSLRILQNKPILVQESLDKFKQCIWPFFLGSLYKPMIFFGGYKLMGGVPNDVEKLSQTMSTNDMLIAASLIIFGFIFATITIFFNSYIVTLKKQTEATILDHLIMSVTIFLKFKWVTLSFIMYFFLFLTLIFLFLAGIVVPIVPAHLQLIVLSVLNAVSSTLFNIFLLRLFLYVKPIFSLNYN